MAGNPHGSWVRAKPNPFFNPFYNRTGGNIPPENAVRKNFPSKKIPEALHHSAWRITR